MNLSFADSSIFFFHKLQRNFSVLVEKAPSALSSRTQYLESKPEMAFLTLQHQWRDCTAKTISISMEVMKRTQTA